VILDAYRRGIFKSKKEMVSIVNNMIKRGFYLSTEVHARLNERTPSADNTTHSSISHSASFRLITSTSKSDGLKLNV